MRTFQRTLLAGAVALALSSPAAAQFTKRSSSATACSMPATSSRRCRRVPACSRPIRGRSGRRCSRRHFGLRSLAFEPGRHRLRVWRRARDGSAGRRPADARLPRPVPIATQIAQYLAKGPDSIRTRRLRDRRRRRTTSSAAAALASRERSRRPSAGQVALAAMQRSPAQHRDAPRRRRALHRRLERARRRQVRLAAKRRSRRRSAASAFRSLVQHDADRGARRDAACRRDSLSTSSRC